MTLLSHIHSERKAPWRSTFMVVMTKPSKQLAGGPALPFLQYTHNQIAHLSKYFSKTMSIALHFLTITAIEGVYAYNISVLLSRSGLFMYMTQYDNLNTSNL